MDYKQMNINLNDLWEQIGSIDEEELPHVLTRLFTSYEEMLQYDPKSLEAYGFFKKLANAIAQTSECNLNRR